MGSLAPLNPSKLEPLPGTAKYMQEEEECIVWDEEEAKSICRRELFCVCVCVGPTVAPQICSDGLKFSVYVRTMSDSLR